MIKNLDTADAIVKLTLAFLVIVCYFIGAISGTLAVVLVTLVVVVIFSIKIFLFFITMD